MKKLKWSYFDSCVGEYDKYNPRYVYNIKYVPEISYTIAVNEPYTLTVEDILTNLNITKEEYEYSIKAMLNINAISEENNRFKINFPVFLERDLSTVNDFCILMGKKLGDKIISLRAKIDELVKEVSDYNNQSIERLRYHIIACDTLDGVALDYFADKGLFNISKRQPDNRDYLIIAHEDNEITAKYSEKLLCSCNSYFIDKYRFMSFGDADGSRNDVMRFFTQLNKCVENTSKSSELNLSYLKLLYDFNKELLLKAGKYLEKCSNSPLLYNESDKKIVELLKSFGYVKVVDGYVKSNVPVFTQSDIDLIEDIGTLIVDELYQDVKSAIVEMENNLTNLTSIKHKVDKKDIANELWHLIFGSINEYLVSAGFIKEPVYKTDEGRYLQAFYINNRKG